MNVAVICGSFRFGGAPADFCVACPVAVCLSLRHRGGAHCRAARTPVEVVCLSLHGHGGALWRGAAPVACARTSTCMGPTACACKKLGVTGAEARWAGGAYAFGLSATTQCAFRGGATLRLLTFHLGSHYFIIGGARVRQKPFRPGMSECSHVR